MLSPRRGTGTRLGAPPSPAASDARSGRIACRLGRWHGDLSGNHVCGPGQSGAVQRRSGDRRARHGPGRLDRAGELATNDNRSLLFGAGNAGVIAHSGRLFRRDDEGRSESYADILGRAGLAQIEGRGASAADAAAQSSYAMYAHGAVFAEVEGGPDLGQIRASHVVGAFAAGRIINPRMVRSQLYGGMIWGMSFAHEQAVMDRRSGRPDEPQSGRVPCP